MNTSYKGLGEAISISCFSFIYSCSSVFYHALLSSTVSSQGSKKVLARHAAWPLCFLVSWVMSQTSFAYKVPSRWCPVAAKYVSIAQYGLSIWGTLFSFLSTFGPHIKPSAIFGHYNPNSWISQLHPCGLPEAQHLFTISFPFPFWPLGVSFFSLSSIKL